MLAVRSGLSQSIISEWIREARRYQPSWESCLRVARALGVPEEEALQAGGYRPEANAVAEERPVYLPDLSTQLRILAAEAPVGIPIVAPPLTADPDRLVSGYLYAARPLLEGHPLDKLVALQVIGASMAPELADGDYVIVELGLPPEPGKLVAATSGNESFVKRYDVVGGRPLLRGNDGQELDAAEARVDGRVIMSLRRHG